MPSHGAKSSSGGLIGSAPPASRYQRSEKALVGTVAKMYAQGVSTHKVKAATEALRRHCFYASLISPINEGLRAVAEKRLHENYPI